MKRVLLTLGLALIFISARSFAQPVGSSDIKAMETFIMVQFQMDVGTAVVREYALSSTGNAEAAATQTSRLSALVQENGLFVERFGESNLQVIRETLTKNNGFITAEYVLAGRARSKEGFMQSLYRMLLDRSVDVRKRGDLLRMQFTETAFSVKQGNGTGIQARGDEVRVEWPEDMQQFELLVAPRNIAAGDLLSLDSWLSASVSGPSPLNEGGTNARLQHDFDLARLHDLMTLSGYIEEYHAATGHYPLQDEAALPNYVFIATRGQQRFVQDMPIPHTTTPVSTLIEELQRVLGAELFVPFDPQQEPVNKPSFYVYMVDGEHWYLAVHLHEAFPFGNRIADYYYKVEVTNNTQRGQGQWLRSDLQQDPQFREVLARRPYQPEYVDNLRQEMGLNKAF